MNARGFFLKNMAERAGFELAIPILPVYSLSRGKQAAHGLMLSVYFLAVYQPNRGTAEAEISTTKPQKYDQNQALFCRIALPWATP